MNVSICIATHGDEAWRDLAYSRPFPSALAQACEVLIEHDPDGNRATVRNGLAEMAHGDYLCFLDGDDELAPGYVGAMQRAFEQEEANGSPLLLTPAVVRVVKGRRQPPMFFPPCDLWNGNWMVVGTLVQREQFQRVGGWYEGFDPANWNEWDDWELWIRCQKDGARPVKVPKALYINHQEATSRQRGMDHETRVGWTQEIQRMHFPERFPVSV